MAGWDARPTVISATPDRYFLQSNLRASKVDAREFATIARTYRKNMVFLSKLLAPALSPIVIVCELLIIAILIMRRWPRAARGLTTAALLVLVIGGNRSFSWLLAESLEFRNLPGRPLPAAQAIVVLSSDAEPAVPPSPSIALDTATANRMLYGAQLYRQGAAPVVILSGGRVPWQKQVTPISQSMAEVIELLGVPKSAVIQEPDSANTYENALDVKAILAARHIDRILLVTSAMHMPRALALFKHQGIDAIAAPCDFSRHADVEQEGWQGKLLAIIPDGSSLNTTSAAIREYLGLAVYHAAGLL
jgi:uncharacterized SAM-binding protein YcdF (DUF218 family)